MAWVNSGARDGLRYAVWVTAAMTAALMISNDAAVARHHRAHAHYVHVERGHHHAAEDYSPPGSSIIVDGNNGTVLEATNPDALRHPASLTKVMTLYLLFERLDAGKIKLDTPLTVSEHASEQAPTKLGLKAGQTIAVEDAIKGIVTKSANDAAVVVAENLGGDEEGFAKMMTAKAHALGMSRTTYVNASGLPDDDQITTARDQALLGRAIQDRFPHYYRYFSTESFVYHGEAMRNHNHLLGAVEGVDGIKTGFTRASGFNLLTSLHRDGRYIVGVVMGGYSASSRDVHMRELISDHFKEASLRRTAPVIADAGELRATAAFPVALARAPLTARADPAPTASVKAGAAAAPSPASLASANDPIKPLLVRTITYRTAPVATAPLAPMPALVPVGTPAQQATIRPQATAAAERPRTVVASADPVVDLKAAAAKANAAPSRPAMGAITPAPQVAAPAVQAPVAAAPVAPPPAIVAPVAAARATPSPITTAFADATDRDQVEPTEPARPEPFLPSSPVHARNGGWLIQIGAFDDESDAKQHLSAAQIKVHGALAAKDPFTERVLKGDKAYYRARFAGFDKATAEAACKQLKRSDFECMALKD